MAILAFLYQNFFSYCKFCLCILMPQFLECGSVAYRRVMTQFLMFCETDRVDEAVCLKD